MKQLTNQQLLLIETTLIEKYNFKNFDDVRLEIQDHISLQIEELINSENISFSDALDRIFKQWNPELKTTDWNNTKVPKLIFDLYNKLDNKSFTIAFTISIVIASACFFIRNYAMSNFIFSFLTTCTYLIFLFILFQTKKNTFKTTLSFYATYRLKYYLLAFATITLIEILIYYLYGKYTFVPNIISLMFAFQFYFRGKIMYRNITIENQLVKVKL